jgi:hypothetical protein
MTSRVSGGSACWAGAVALGPVALGPAAAGVRAGAAAAGAGVRVWGCGDVVPGWALLAMVAPR